MITTPTITPARRRADPLTSLANRGLLAVGDARQNAVMLAAGMAYRSLAEAAEVSGLQSSDLSRPIVDGGRAPAASERGAQARDKLKKADAAVGARSISVLRAIAIDETPISELRHLVAEVRDRNAANAVLMDRLSDALCRLADHWSMHGRKQSPLTSWRAA